MIHWFSTTSVSTITAIWTQLPYRISRFLISNCFHVPTQTYYGPNKFMTYLFSTTPSKRPNGYHMHVIRTVKWFFRWNTSWRNWNDDLYINPSEIKTKQNLAEFASVDCILTNKPKHFLTSNKTTHTIMGSSGTSVLQNLHMQSNQCHQNNPQETLTSSCISSVHLQSTPFSSIQDQCHKCLWITTNYRL